MFLGVHMHVLCLLVRGKAKEVNEKATPITSKKPKLLCRGKALHTRPKGEANPGSLIPAMLQPSPQRLLETELLCQALKT